jgi:hypothetical protein
MVGLDNLRVLWCNAVAVIIDVAVVVIYVVAVAVVIAVAVVVSPVFLGGLLSRTHLD